MESTRTYSVSQLNNEIKGLLESNPSFRNLFVRGEISNFKAHTSGHCYFTLKDNESSISAVMFRGDAARLRFAPRNGMQVIARGRVDSFPKTGQVQLYLTEMVMDGMGNLHLAYEQLKTSLFQEGLFEQSHKKDLPLFPFSIALITAPTGAAVHDMIRILRRRWPVARVLIYPALVQGKDAPVSLIKALENADRDGLADLIIIGRGGGSLEDLWAFNDEHLARCIYACQTPVISAVGHEPDVTIADFVADRRAPTPSGAAEIAVPVYDELFAACEDLQNRLVFAQSQQLRKKQQNISQLFHRLQMQTPERYVEEKRKQLRHLKERMQWCAQGMLDEKRLTVDFLTQHMQGAVRRHLDHRHATFQQYCAALDAMSPLRVLGRGYTITSNAKGKIITDSADIAQGEVINVRFAQGSVLCSVEEIREED